MRYYAIPDIHGRYDILDACLNKIADTAKEDFKIVTLGDYIDRGPDSARVIQRLMDEKKKFPNTYVCLRGNHEEMMLDWARGIYPLDWWISNGGYATLTSYGGLDKDDPHIGWVSKLPYYYETPRHVFVHAGIPTDDPLEDQNKERLTWMLYANDDQGGWWKDHNQPKTSKKHVVHGHHIHEDGPHEWDYRTALDTGSFYTNRHIIGVFDDSQGRAKEFIEVTV